MTAINAVPMVRRQEPRGACGADMTRYETPVGTLETPAPMTPAGWRALMRWVLGGPLGDDPAGWAALQQAAARLRG